MSFRTSVRLLPERFHLVCASFLQTDELPFSDVLPEDKIQQVFDQHGVAFGQEESDVYTPAITLWAFLSQVLFKEEHRSCAAAVARVVTLLVALGRNACSDNTGAYCRARAKLAEPVLQQLVQDVADGCEQQVPRRWLWKRRHVRLVDGTTVSMPDTEENQQAWPQHGAQKKGVGFPIARVLVLISLATGMVSDLAIGPYMGKETGETALLRELLARFDRNDILLADRYFCSYFMIALLQWRQIDIVTRQHQMRNTDFRRGRRLGRGDHLIEWTRPQQPDWMDEETYALMPESITVREIQVQVQQPGFRVQSLLVVTTLTDAETYSKAAMAELYEERWLVELDIRTIKCTLDMDVLRAKTPEMVRREIWSHLLAYNLIRQAILAAAQRGKDRSPREISFTAALQKIAASWITLATCTATQFLTLLSTHLDQLFGHRVGHRPNRVEPRAVKRRPKSQSYLNDPRDVARAKLLNGKS